MLPACLAPLVVVQAQGGKTARKLTYLSSPQITQYRVNVNITFEVEGHEV